MKIVLLRRGFFTRGVACSISDSLLWGASLAGVSERAQGEERCVGESKGMCEDEGEGTKWDTTLGCRVMTESSGYDLSGAEPIKKGYN